jgi:hypothetical protein
MWRVNFCPNCGARTTKGGRFCGTCGFNLISVIPHMPSPPYEYQWQYQQWVPSNSGHDQWIGYASGEDRNTAPMSGQISKMLEDLFEKRLKYNKT